MHCLYNPLWTNSGIIQTFWVVLWRERLEVGNIEISPISTIHPTTRHSNWSATDLNWTVLISKCLWILKKKMDWNACKVNKVTLLSFSYDPIHGVLSPCLALCCCSWWDYVGSLITRLHGRLETQHVTGSVYTVRCLLYLILNLLIMIG